MGEAPALAHSKLTSCCRGSGLRILAELKDERENDRKHSVCKLPFLPLWLSWLNANGVFGGDECGE